MELKIEHISKQFKDKTAVDDVSLTLTTGVWGLLGANGAGKTTLMRILADIMTPSNGLHLSYRHNSCRNERKYLEDNLRRYHALMEANPSELEQYNEMEIH